MENNVADNAKEKILIEIDCKIIPALVVEYKTGIFYTSQVGGHACFHPECEGFVLPLYSEGIKEFEDCDLLCFRSLKSAMGEEEYNEWNAEENGNEYKLEVANKLNKLFSELIISYDLVNLKECEINREKISDLTEGWWPVKFKMSKNRLGLGEEGIFSGTGYIHIGNCD